MVEPQPKMPVYMMDLKMKFVRETKKFSLYSRPDEATIWVRVKLYFTYSYLFISILYFVLGYYAFRFTL